MNKFKIKKIAIKIDQDNSYQTLLRELSKKNVNISPIKIGRNGVVCKNYINYPKFLDFINRTIPRATIRCVECGVELKIVDGKKQTIHTRAIGDDGNHKVYCNYMSNNFESEIYPSNISETKGSTLWEKLYHSTVRISNLIVITNEFENEFVVNFGTGDRLNWGKTNTKKFVQSKNIFVIYSDANLLNKVYEKRKFAGIEYDTLHLKSVKFNAELWDVVILINEEVKNKLFSIENINDKALICFNQVYMYPKNKEGKKNRYNVMQNFTDMLVNQEKIYLVNKKDD